MADRGTSADREITLTGRCATPTHSSVSSAGWSGLPLTTLSSVLLNHNMTAAATGSSTAKATQFGRARTPWLTSSAMSAANAKPGSHHHHGTHNRSR